MRTGWALLAAGAILAAGPLAAQQEQRTALSLSMKRAVEIATSPEGNSSIQLAVQSLKQAQERSLEARGALLPDVEGALRLPGSVHRRPSPMRMRPRSRSRPAWRARTSRR